MFCCGRFSWAHPYQQQFIPSSAGATRRTSAGVLPAMASAAAAAAAAASGSEVPATPATLSPRVLSIQSHVVSGYVGNKARGRQCRLELVPVLPAPHAASRANLVLPPAPSCRPPRPQCAVLPLQLLGFDVDPINSVQFSNHTGFPSWNGDIMNGEQLWALVEGLEANGLVRYTHLLTGQRGGGGRLCSCGMPRVACCGRGGMAEPPPCRCVLHVCRLYRLAVPAADNCAGGGAAAPAQPRPCVWWAAPE